MWLDEIGSMEQFRRVLLPGLTSFGFGRPQGRETIKTCANTRLLVFDADPVTRGHMTVAADFPLLF